MSRLTILLLLFPIVIRADGLPLFDADESLNIVLEFPLKTVLKEAADRPVVDGMAHYQNSNGETVSLPVKISTRGRSRLEACKFPPLSLGVKKKSSKGTVFEGQKNLKIVTHCRSNAIFKSYVHQEYGIYRAFNVLTDVSYRVRALNVTYRDTENRVAEIQERAFFIESIGEIAERTQFERQRARRVEVTQLDPAYATLHALFQFMVGNTDWSVKMAPDDSDCCHNGRVLSPPKESLGWMVVPYDFDQSGIVNPRYAMPAPQLGISTVRQRLYRGRCVHNDQLDSVIQLLNERRAELEEALLPDGIRNEKTAADYVASFYRIINDAKQRERSIEKRCLSN
jgi:hypothetical protein